MDRQASSGLFPNDASSHLAQDLDVRSQFADVTAFCMFLGYPRSGHSLVGSLLNAHPDVVLAHELDVLRYVRRGFSRFQLYRMLLENERAFGERGRIQTGYDYTVPGQWQGRYRTLRVIGDKKGGRSTARVARRPELIPGLRATVGVPLRIVHVIRNPFDNIATMTNRDDLDLELAIHQYFSLAETVSGIRCQLGPGEIIDLPHESLIIDARETLTKLGFFLGVEAPDDYLSACASIVFDSPRKTRHSVQWTPALIGEVERRKEVYDFLRGYSFAS